MELIIGIVVGIIIGFVVGTLIFRRRYWHCRLTSLRLL